jgi:hypothetical protein
MTEVEQLDPRGDTSMNHTGPDSGHSAATDQTELSPALVVDPCILPAPRWRRWAAHSIDLTIVLIVLALFLAPVIVVYSRGGHVSGLLKGSAWVYVAVFVGLALSMTRGRKRERRYVTVGMNILRLQPSKTGKTLRCVDGRNLPDAGDERRGRAMALIAFPVMLIGVAFFVFELLSYL